MGSSITSLLNVVKLMGFSPVGKDALDIIKPMILITGQIVSVHLSQQLNLKPLAAYGYVITSVLSTPSSLREAVLPLWFTYSFALWSVGCVQTQKLCCDTFFAPPPETSYNLYAFQIPSMYNLYTYQREGFHLTYFSHLHFFIYTIFDFTRA